MTGGHLQTLVTPILILLFGSVDVSGQPPVFGNIPTLGYIVTNEDFPVGGLLLSFTVSGNKAIVVSTLGFPTQELVNISQTDGNNIIVNVTTAQLLDRDGTDLPGTSPVDLRFQANAEGETSIAQVRVYIGDINDNHPIFQKGPYSWEVKELPFVGNETYSTISAIDYDNDMNGTRGIRYRLVPEVQSTSAEAEYLRKFSIDNKTGEIKLKEPLDYATNSYYQFTVVAEDNLGTGLNSTADLVIRVLDVQDKPPFFIGQPYRKTIEENVPSGTSVVSVSARDGDTGLSNPVNYSILADDWCSQLFTIDKEGKISTAGEIDRDKGPVNDAAGVCVIKVMAEEEDPDPTKQYGDTNETSEVTISIQDVNDNIPVFSGKTYHAEVLENTPTNVPITLDTPNEIWVSDADQDRFAEINLHLIYPNKTNCTDFDVSPNFVRKNGSVLIRVRNPSLLDYEMIQNITFLIVATERSNTTHSATATVLLGLLDMNDNNPQFANESYKFSIPENSPDNYSVGNITATDRDSGEHGNLTYSLSGGNNKFKVDKFTGEITTSCSHCEKELDRERTDVYYLTYTATDHGGRSNSTSLEIVLTDVNDNPPIFDRNLYLAAVDENDDRYNNTPLLEIRATDADKENTNNSQIIFRITNMSSTFIINETTGAIYMSRPVDYEALDEGMVTLTVEAKDLGEPPRSANTTVEIKVQDLNDNSPDFNSSLFHARVTENSTSSISQVAVVGQVIASDADATERNNKFQYFITSGSMDHFRINSTSGEVSVQINAKLNREDISSYNVTIMAIDQGSPPLTGSTTLSIDVLDVNDELPVFNESNYRKSIMENQTEKMGIVIATVGATDADEDSELKFDIVQVHARDENGAVVNSTLVTDWFGIHQNNGSIYVKDLSDREVAQTVMLQLLVSDVNAYHPNPQNDSAIMTITIEDINDNPPVFEEKEYRVNVSENAQNPTILLTVSATDRDKNRTLTYSIQSTSYNRQSFTIDPKSGVLSKTGIIDREEEPLINVTVQAADNGVPSLNSSVNVIVDILDFNDNEPEFVNWTDTIHVLENATAATELIQISATDKDTGPNENVTFFIESGDYGRFSLDLLTGNLSLYDDELDRENKSMYVLRIKAMDNPVNPRESKFTTKTLTIHIDDVNDNAPIFTSTNYTTTILENVENGTIVLRVTATDVDAGDNSRVSYSLENTQNNLFAIDKVSGDIFVSSSLIGETRPHVLSLVAEDHGIPSLNNTSKATIFVQDVNLNAPFIVNPPSNGTIKVYECVKEGYDFYKFNYSDRDSGVNAEASFNISGIDDDISQTFQMEENGTLKLKSKLDAVEKSSYRFQVQVTDKGMPPLSSDKLLVTVKVIDVDDNMPEFENDAVSFSIRENQPPGTVVGTVTAEDKDLESVACYDTKDDNFKVGLHNGSIVSTRPFDYENVTHYHFLVNVKDCLEAVNISECGNVTRQDGNGHTAINVAVNVIDVNDNPPVFKNDEVAVGMLRVTEAGTTLDLSLKTSDYIADNDTAVNGNLSWKFINAGQLMLSESLQQSVQPLSGVNVCQDGKKHIICVTGNGTLVNNKFFSEDIFGNILVPVNVSDDAGSDVMNVRVYLIGDTQVLIMTLFGKKEDIAERKNAIMDLYSKLTGYGFVYDWLEDHKTPDGRVETLKTDLYFHIVDLQTKRVLSSAEALRIVDENYDKLQEAVRQYAVLQITSSQRQSSDEDDPTRTIYILGAVIAVLSVTVAVIIYVSLTTRSAYQRKLRAATVNVSQGERKDTIKSDDGFVPGSNQYCKISNPLLNAAIPREPEYDSLSMSSTNTIDQNSVGAPRQDCVGAAMEEKEIRLDMYLEEGCQPSESPLDAALRLHSKNNSSNSGSSNTEDALPENRESFAFENSGYVDELESTEI